MHSPSEHTIDGKLYDLEIHFVHRINDNAKTKTFKSLDVVGLLFEVITKDEDEDETFSFIDFLHVKDSLAF